MLILKDLECTEIVQMCKGNDSHERAPGGTHPHLFAESADLSDTKGLGKSRDAKESVTY